MPMLPGEGKSSARGCMPDLHNGSEPLRCLVGIEAGRLALLFKHTEVVETVRNIATVATTSHCGSPQATLPPHCECNRCLSDSCWSGRRSGLRSQGYEPHTSILLEVGCKKLFAAKKKSNQQTKYVRTYGEQLGSLRSYSEPLESLGKPPLASFGCETADMRSGCGSVWV